MEQEIADLKARVEALESVVASLIRRGTTSELLVEIAGREYMASNPAVQQLFQQAARLPDFAHLPDATPAADTVLVPGKESEDESAVSEDHGVQETG